VIGNRGPRISGNLGRLKTDRTGVLVLRIPGETRPLPDCSGYHMLIDASIHLIRFEACTILVDAMLPSSS
jgi:hypothetical protein